MKVSKTASIEAMHQDWGASPDGVFGRYGEINLTYPNQKSTKPVDPTCQISLSGG
jgi:hypothetical protein